MPDTTDPDAAPLWRRIRGRPRVVDRTRAQDRVGEFAAGLDAEATALVETPRVRALLAGIADHSPFLWQLMAAEPARTIRLLTDDPAERLRAVLTSLRAGGDESEARVMRRLRRARQEIALLVAVADLGGVWSLGQVMQALSDSADMMIQCALDHVLRTAAAGKLRPPDPQWPQAGCGLAVLGLGKLGGRELNYSSDVDLVVVFDPACPAIVSPDEAKTLYVRIVRDLLRLLQHPTADGFVLRVDLRLRPDPGATAIAIGLDAAFHYYETVGQTWERAAMIKARPVAGDRGVARTFLDGMAAFVWRKYFDYAAIADIHAMKRQIHAAKGHGDVAVAGHDVKLGRGGIREIEFFVQTQQLIFGGKRPELRGSRTLAMLRQLRRDRRIGAHAASDLTRAYDFLRRVEHRLQMIADAQTHRLPKDAEGLERFARFCGFARAERFAAVLVRHLCAVQHHYARLFESAPDGGDTGGSFVFTGVDDDPETIRALAALGYRAPEMIARLVRDWHAGRRPAVRTGRAREILTGLVPKLLVTFAGVSDPDGAVSAFDAALERMPAAAELFAMLDANEGLRSLFGDILGSAPHLGAALVRRPHLLDGAIGASLNISLDEDEMEARASLVLDRSGTTEELLDAIRDFQQEEHFLIGVALLAGELDPADAGLAYSALAVAVVRVVLRRLRETFAREHGVVRDAAMAVVAMGKLGSREMTAASDLDLVLLYTFDPRAPESDGAKRLHATPYFTRLTQRLVSHLTVATRRGRLYEVDMRLRPSGRQGPLATKLSAFVPYQREEAETWEHMALTRARVVAGGPGFAARVASEVAAVLRGPPPADLREQIVAMRALIAREKPSRGRWDLKLLPGGLIDLEFIAQWLVLTHGAERPEILHPSTEAVMRRAADLGVLDRAVAGSLIAAHRLMTSATQIMRLSLGESRSPDEAAAGVQRRIAVAAGATDLCRLAEDIAAARQAVREIFLTLLSPEATA